MRRNILKTYVLAFVMLMATSANAGVRLPSIPKGAHYPKVRALMIKAGFLPQPIAVRPEYSFTGCDDGKSEFCKKYPEIIMCSVEGSCQFMFAHYPDNRLVLVSTYGDSDLINCYCFSGMRWMKKIDRDMFDEGLVIAKPSSDKGRHR